MILTLSSSLYSIRVASMQSPCTIIPIYQLWPRAMAPQTRGKDKSRAATPLALFVLTALFIHPSPFLPTTISSTTRSASPLSTSSEDVGRNVEGVHDVSKGLLVTASGADQGMSSFSFVHSCLVILASLLIPPSLHTALRRSHTTWISHRLMIFTRVRYRPLCGLDGSVLERNFPRHA